ncbi:uncharacterized protein LOC133792166 [Humulus lupulus]|uniref:uncharacterized protein LOC133792166 n=1 Tax=Humulus lupulus TaxID=3486 RepID=UPI002B40E626|nr:uncharacterized protein LOC133792166 [Humulus lupulus]
MPKKEEVKSVVFELHPLKAPGPNGMSGFFYMKYWDITSDNFTDCVQDIFRTGYFDPKVNHSFICLIHKKENVDTVDNFRLISLCNFIYKVISRLVSNRMRGIIGKLISLFQAAFILGRWIVEASILTQEIVHTIKKKGKGGLTVINVDMHKAYDRMEWHFLLQVLKENGSRLIFANSLCGVYLQSPFRSFLMVPL